MSLAHSIYKTCKFRPQFALLILCMLAFGVTCQGCSNSAFSKDSQISAAPVNVEKTNDEWKKQLTPLQYKVTREQGTEEAFRGAYTDNHDNGIYNCVACGNHLFSSTDKFDSGTGWPSFTAAVKDDNVVEKAEAGRREVVCAKCDSHLGHVFPDGPAPTNSRYCINSCALQFVKKEGQ